MFARTQVAMDAYWYDAPDKLKAVALSIRDVISEVVLREVSQFDKTHCRSPLLKPTVDEKQLKQVLKQSIIPYTLVNSRIIMEAAGVDDRLEVQVESVLSDKGYGIIASIIPKRFAMVELHEGAEFLH
jgi:hypothetical protein